MQVNVDDCWNAEKNKPKQDGVLPEWKEAAEKGRRLKKIEALEKAVAAKINDNIGVGYYLFSGVIMMGT